jgi:hypothetical protein
MSDGVIVYDAGDSFRAVQHAGRQKLFGRWRKGGTALWGRPIGGWSSSRWSGQRGACILSLDLPRPQDDPCSDSHEEDEWNKRLFHWLLLVGWAVRSVA